VQHLLHVQGQEEEHREESRHADQPGDVGRRESFDPEDRERNPELMARESRRLERWVDSLE
jgi:hypothetical protein